MFNQVSIQLTMGCKVQPLVLVAWFYSREHIEKEFEKEDMPLAVERYLPELLHQLLNH
jgi:hypothetical protein